MFKRENERIKPSKQPNKTGPIPRPKRRKPEEIGVGALAQIFLSPSSPVRQYANPFIKAPLRAGTELPCHVDRRLQTPLINEHVD